MSAKRIELVASAAQTATGNSNASSVPTITMAIVAIDITAVSALTDFTAWLEGSDDGGTTWYTLIADWAVKNDTDATKTAPALDQRDICKETSGVSKHIAQYGHLPTDTVRLAWNFSGTSVTFSASLVGK